MYKKTYDLEERTAVFAEELIKFCSASPKNLLTTPLLSQLVRSGTSIGANYCEANGASSKKDFRNKIFICKKEAKETLYWLRLIEGVISTQDLQYLNLKKEANELMLIFSKIASHS